MIIIDYADYNDLGTRDCSKNNFIIDYADCTDDDDTRILPPPHTLTSSPGRLFEYVMANFLIWSIFAP